MTTQHTHNAHLHEHSAGSDDTMTGLLELDGEVLRDYWSAARAWFTRLSAGLADQLEPDDQATLTTLLAALLADQGPGTVPDPADLHIRGTRTVTLARRADA